MSKFSILTSRNYDMNYMCIFSREDNVFEAFHHQGLLNRIISGIRAVCVCVCLNRVEPFPTNSHMEAQYTELSDKLLL